MHKGRAGSDNPGRGERGGGEGLRMNRGAGRQGSPINADPPPRTFPQPWTRN